MAAATAGESSSETARTAGETEGPGGQPQETSWYQLLW